jgi:small subunit ribosomal protein S8
MSLSDPIADMLTIIRNAGRAGHASCKVKGSKVKQSILGIMKDEGFIQDYQPITVNKFTDYEVFLKYAGLRNPVTNTLQRISKPGRRVYIKHTDIKPIKSNMGISIISTSKGIMTNKKAAKLNLGGEVLCEIS